jgi:hypothetical protein
MGVWTSLSKVTQYHLRNGMKDPGLTETNTSSADHTIGQKQSRGDGPGSESTLEKMDMPTNGPSSLRANEKDESPKTMSNHEFLVNCVTPSLTFLMIVEVSE